MKEQNLLKGNLIWKDKSRKEVIFVPDLNGKFTIDQNTENYEIGYCG